LSRKRKKKVSSGPDWPGKVLGLLLGPGRPLTIAVLAAGVVLVGWYFVWSKVRQRVLSSDDYLVTAAKVEITPAPAWIHSDVRGEAFRNASLDGPLSIMDDDLVERIGNAFSLHPWVAEVSRVGKHHPARVEIDLVYRRPVCVVEVPGDLLPVDGRGVLLPPGDFSPVEKSRYPRLTGVDTYPLSTAGEPWGDARVAGGAEIAAALAEVWEQFKLAKIVSMAGDAADEPVYTLVTRGGTRIYWGRSPGSPRPGGLTVPEKIDRLREYIAEHGNLEGRSAPQSLDINRLRTPRISSRPKP